MIAKWFLWRDHSLHADLRILGKQRRKGGEREELSARRGARKTQLRLFSPKICKKKNAPVQQARYNTTLVPEVFLDFVSFREPAKKASGARVREHKK